MAEEKIVTSIVANSDFSNLIADVQRVTASLSRLQQEFAGANRALAGQIDATNAMFSETMRKTGQFSTHFVSLTSDVEKFGRNLDSGRLKLRDYFRVYQEHTKTSGGLIRDLAKQQVQLQNAVLQPLGRNAQGLMQYNVHIPRGLDLTKNKTSLLKQELQIMNKVIQDGGVQLINWGKNTQWAGRQLTVGLTLPLAAFGKAAADAFKQADQELTRLTKVYGDIAGSSAQELTKIRGEVAATAKELSSAMGVNFTETIGLAADIAATGKTGNELLASVSETTRLAVLGEVDRQEAMKATLAIQSAFKQNTDQLAESINFLNAVENQTSTTLNDLVEAIPKAGPVIKGLGGSVQDLALYLTAMREGGINASEGANALKSALASLINPTDVAVAKFQTFGIDLLGIVNKNAGDVTGTLLALQSALDTLNPLQKQQAIEQLFGKFQFSRLNALFENLGRQGSQTLQVLDLMKASAGELEAVAGRELAAVTESASGRYRRAVEGLKAELAGVGDEFLDIGTKLVNVLSGIIDFAQKLPDPIKKILAFGGAFTAIIGPIIMLTGVLANFFGYIIKGLGHFKALFKGAEGFKLLTPEIMAARAAGAQLADEFYSDAAAADTLRLAIRKLNEDLVSLRTNAASVNLQNVTTQTVSTVAGTPVMTVGGGRVTDPNHPLLGGQTRAAAHLNPRDPNNPSSIFGLTMQPVPVNRKLGRTPQIMMTERLPDVEGLTSVGGISTGVVAGEHARYSALMAALGVQSRQEIEQLKKTIAMGGQVSKEFIDTFDDILPITQKLTQNAAAQSAAIVADLRAGKLNVEQARAAIISVNADLERMMGAEVSQYAASRGRTIDLTKAPLIDQPVVDVKGKPNVRGMFRQGIFARVMSAVGKATRTRTVGGPYSIETTKPQGLNAGGPVYLSNGSKSPLVPGPNVNADVVPAVLTPGEFVVNREATAKNLPLLMAINGGPGSNGPGYDAGGLTKMALDLRGRFTNKDYDEDIRLRTIMHDAAIINRMGFDVDESIDIAEKNYRQALKYSFDRNMPGGPDINPDRWVEIRNQQLKDFDELAFRKTGRRAIVQPTGNRPTSGRLTQGVRPSLDLINAMRMRGGQFSQNIFESVVRDISRPVGRNRFAYESEHTVLPYGGWQKEGTLGVGNLFQAIAGSREVNLASSNLNRATRGAIPNVTPLTRRSAGMHWNSIVKMIAMSRGRPLVRANRGGLIPGYQEGGRIQRSGAGSMLGQMALSSLGYYGGSALGSRFGSTGSMIGGMIGGMFAPALMGGMGGFRREQDPTIYTEKLGRSVLRQKEWAKAAAEAATQGKSWGRVLTGLIGGITKTNLFIGGATLAIAGAIKVWKDYNETQRLSAAAFGLTAESAQKAGLQYTDYTKKIKDAIDAQKLMLDQNKLTYENMASAGTPFKMTIAEYKKLRKELKETMAEQIKVINATPASGANRLAVQLKEQLVAAGLSAEEATKRIYTLFNLSDKSRQSLSAISTDEFKKIVDAQTAAVSALESFNYAKSFENSRDAATALNTALTAINTGIEDYISKGEESARKKGQEFDETKAAYEAEKKQLDLIANKVKSQESIGQGVLNQLKKQNPEIEKFINSQDTAVSIFEKLRLVARGFTGDLQNLNAQQTDAVYKLQIATTQAVQTVNEKGILSKQYDAYNKLKAQRDALAKAAKGQSVQEQIDTKERLKAIDKEIAAINKKAESRKKALQEEAQAEDINLRIQKQKMEYEKMVSAGDFGGAAQAKIELTRLINEQQLNISEQQIEEQRIRKVTPLEKEREAIQSAQDKLSDKAALAAESLDSVNKKLAAQKEKIDAVNNAMANLKVAMDMHKDDLTTFKQSDEFKGLAANFVKAVQGTGQVVSTTALPDVVNGKLQEDIGTKATDLLSKYSSEITTIVAQKGVVVTSSGDIIVDGKKVSGGEKTGPQYSKTSPLNISNIPGARSYETNKEGEKAGILTTSGSVNLVKERNLVEGDFFTYNGTLYKVQNVRSRLGFNLGLGGIPQKADGGLLKGPGTGKSDSILGMYANGGMVRVSNGEYVINADTVNKLGVPFFDRINGMKNGGLMLNYDIPKYSDGGTLINTMPYKSDIGGSVYNVGNVTMQFAEAPANGKQLFEEFKAAIALDQKKKGPERNISRRYA